MTMLTPTLLVSLLVLGTPALCSPDSTPKPFGLNWNSETKTIPKVDGFIYKSGSPSQGVVLMLSEEEHFSIPAELRLIYSKKRKLKSAYLTFGPTGLSAINCKSRYKEVVRLLNLKYGHYKYRKEFHDSMAYDLVYDAFCNQVRTNLRQVVTRWKSGLFTIDVWLFGDEYSIFIEAEYEFRPRRILKKNKALRGSL